MLVSVTFWDKLSSLVANEIIAIANQLGYPNYHCSYTWILPSIRVIVFYSNSQLMYIWTNDFRLTDDGRLFPSLHVYYVYIIRDVLVFANCVASMLKCVGFWFYLLDILRAVCLARKPTDLFPHLVCTCIICCWNGIIRVTGVFRLIWNDAVGFGRHIQNDLL